MIRSEIAKGAAEKITIFMEVADKLGLNNDVDTLSALAGLLVYSRWPYEVMSLHKTLRYLGLRKPTREDIRKFEERSEEKYRRLYSGHATIIILKREKHFPAKSET